MTCYHCLSPVKRRDMKPQQGKAAKRGGRSLCCPRCGKTTMMKGG